MHKSNHRTPAGLRALLSAPPRIRLWFGVALVIVGCSLLACTAHSQSSEMPRSGLISRQAVALNPATDKAYVVAPARDSVAILDGLSGSAKYVRVGKGPVAIAVNSKMNVVYVANHDDGSVSVVNGNSDQVTATIRVGNLPYAMAVDSSSGSVYISNVFSQTLTVIDGSTNKTSTINDGSADAMLVDPAMHRLYMLGYESSEINMLDTTNQTKSRAPMGTMHLWGMAFNPITEMLFVTQIGNAGLVEYDGRLNTSKFIETGNYPCAVAVSSRTNRVYVVNYLDGTVTVVDAAMNAAVATVKTGNHPQGIAIDENSNRIYIANTYDNTVTVIDGGTNVVLVTLKAGTNPFAIVVDPRTRVLYVANSSGEAWTRMDVKDLSKMRALN